MKLTIPFDPSDLAPNVVHALDDLIAALQTWAGKLEGIGKWISVPYASSLYGQNVGAWGVGQSMQQLYRYTVVGDTMTIQVYLSGTTTNASVDEELHVYMPDGFAADMAGSSFPSLVGTVSWYDSTSVNFGTGLAMINFADNVPASDRRITLLRNIAGSAWPISSTNMNVAFFVTLPIRRI